MVRVGRFEGGGRESDLEIVMARKEESCFIFWKREGRRGRIVV